MFLKEERIYMKTIPREFDGFQMELLNGNKTLTKTSIISMLKKHFALEKKSDMIRVLRLVHKAKMDLMLQMFWGEYIVSSQNKSPKICVRKSYMVRSYENIESFLVKELGKKYQPSSNRRLKTSFVLLH